MEWNVNYLIPGLRLASNVYFPNANSELLFEEGCILTKEMISKLKRRKIAIVSVEIDETINHYDDELFCQTCELFRTCDISNILKIIRKYVDIATNSDNLIFDIRKYFTGENDFFSHMTNMLVMSIALAKWHNQSSSKNQRIPLDKVAQLAAFKDIGWIAKSDNIRGLLKDKYALIIESLRKRFPKFLFRFSMIISKNIAMYIAILFIVNSYLILKWRKLYCIVRCLTHLKTSKLEQCVMSLN